MRVAFLLPALNDTPTGGYKVAYEYANHLTRQGHECTVFFIASINKRRVRAAARSAVQQVRHRKRDSLLTWFELAPEVALRQVATLRHQHVSGFDVVVSTAWQTAEQWGQVRRSDQRGIYLLQHFETWSGPEARVLDTFRLPLEVVAVSSWLANLASEHGAPHVRWIPNGIDPRMFRMVGGPATRRPNRVLMMWHPDQWKGGKVALEAVRRATALRPDLEMSCFSAYRPPEGFPQGASFHFRPSSQDLVALYNEASVFVSASFSEGWGLPATEAMACGCALAATDIPGIADYAVHDRTALLVPPGDAVALGNAVARLTADPALHQRIALQGQERIKGFTSTQSALAFEDAVLARPKGSG